MKTFLFISLLSAVVLVDTSPEQKFRAAEEVTITTAVSHDVYVAAGKIIVSAPVRGDLLAAGGSVMVRDQIEGDLILAGGDLVVDGAVGEDLLVMGGNVKVLQPVQGDLIVMGGDVTIDQDVTIGQDLVVMGGAVNVYGDIAGSMMARGGKLTLEGICQGDLDVKGGEVKLNGTVRGASTLAAETIDLGAAAKLYGHVNYWTEEGDIDFSSALMENVKASFDERLSVEDSSWVIQPFAWIPFVIAYLLSALLIIALLHVLLPKVMEQSGSMLNQEAVRSFGYGVLYFLAVPVAVALLMMSVVGIPLGLLLMAIYFFSVWFALSVAAVIITCQISDRYHYQWSRAMMVLVSLGTFLVLRAISFLPLIGFILVAVVVAACVGALLLSLFYKEKPILA